MSDRYIYDLGDNRTMHVRISKWAEPGMEVRLVVREWDREIVSPPLPDVQLGLIANVFSDCFFERTQRVVWPVEGPMLHLYVKAQMAAEAKFLDVLRANPSPESQAHAERFEAKMRAAYAEPSAPAEFDPEDPPGEVVLRVVEASAENDNAPEPPTPPKENGATRRRQIGAAPELGFLPPLPARRRIV